mgnify:CR=1 FL=1
MSRLLYLIICRAPTKFYFTGAKPVTLFSRGREIRHILSLFIVTRHYSWHNMSQFCPWHMLGTDFTLVDLSYRHYHSLQNMNTDRNDYQSSHVITCHHMTSHKMTAHTGHHKHDQTSCTFMHKTHSIQILTPHTHLWCTQSWTTKLGLLTQTRWLTNL